MFRISGFGDEISPELDEQLRVLRSLGIGRIEVRGVWGKGILDLSLRECGRAAEAIREAGLSVSALASPIGKYPIDAPVRPQVEALRGAAARARAFGTEYIRVFSFYIPEGDDPDAWRGEVVSRMRMLAAVAAEEGVTLLLENEARIYGTTGERNRHVLEAVDADGAPGRMWAVFDPSNYVMCGEDTLAAYAAVKPWVRYLHVKDAQAGPRRVVVAGEGDGHLREILTDLHASGFDGIASLEPHLAEAGPFAGFSGPERFRAAARAFFQLIEEVGAAHDALSAASLREALPPGGADA